jgi:uncharacterized protein (TIGR02599 family)
MLVAIAILLVVMITVLKFCEGVERAWKRAAADPYADAESAFETVTRNLATATLEPYRDYADINGAFRTNSATAPNPPFVPDHLARRSDLDFVCGPAAGLTGLLAASNRTSVGDAIFFLAPQGNTQTYASTGMARLLNAMGYFVEFGADNTAPAFVQSPTWRWRLKQVVQPAESVQIYATTNASDWIQQLVPTGATCPVLADNVIALVISPEQVVNHATTPLTPAFSYNSRDGTNKLTLHQLPPLLRVVLVAIDETTALRLATQSGTSPPQLVSANLFQSTALLDADIATLDGALTAQNIGHRIFQRDILLSSSNWSNIASQ